MKIIMNEVKTYDAKYVRIKLPINDIPKHFPLVKDEFWEAIVNLETGQVLNWETGRSCEIINNVADEGFFELLDDNLKPITYNVNYYVPNQLIPPTNGYGDLVHLVINEEGLITNWYAKPSLIEFYEEN